MGIVTDEATWDRRNLNKSQNQENTTATEYEYEDLNKI